MWFWTGFVTNIHAKPFLFWFGFLDKMGISPGQFSHCVMDLLQYKNKKGSYKPLQVRRHRTGWFGRREEHVAARKTGEAEECWQPEKNKQRNPKAGLKTFRVVDGENLSNRDRVWGVQSQNMVKILPQEGQAKLGWVKIKVWHVKHKVFLFLDTAPEVGRKFKKLNAKNNLQQKNFSLRTHLNKSSMISTQK